MKPSIHIATGISDTFRSKYVVARLAEHWRQWGYVVSQGPVEVLTADLGILHVDQTCVPDAAIPSLRPGQRLLNGQVRDISKKIFSSLRVSPGDSWGGPVIIKQNLNCFGAPESKQRKEGFIEAKRRRWSKKHWRWLRTLPSRDYPVLASAAEVPGWVWGREDLLVERFLPERVGDQYAVRGWLFWGDRGYAYRLFSKRPVVKTANTDHYEILDRVPPELEQFRRAHAMDFGKLDYVEVEGRPVVLDMNKTPTTVAPLDSPRLRDLAEGVRFFLEGSS